MQKLEIRQEIKDLYGFGDTTSPEANAILVLAEILHRILDEIKKEKV